MFVGRSGFSFHKEGGVGLAGGLLAPAPGTMCSAWGSHGHAGWGGGAPWAGLGIWAPWQLKCLRLASRAGRGAKKNPSRLLRWHVLKGVQL